MSVLSAQSIRRLCQVSRPLINPFVERSIFAGRSFGLSACTYDCRIAQDLTLEPGRAALASTIEEFCLPPNVCGSVLDKSSYARIFVSAFNTHLDPGWYGFLTVELANLGDLEVIYRAGSPLCQVKFEFLDEPTEIPYRGKYLGQENRPVGLRFEPEEK
jgi:dCTP deaminase